MNYQSNKYLVRYADFMYSRSAFVDARTPGSHLKENYCIIGPGVSQDSRQPVHIRETDGFNFGAAGQPPGILNLLHSHFTAEIFIVYKGTFRIYWGAEGKNEAFLGPGDVISVPTNCFRGFEVTGTENGFMYVILGGDDSGGGILWHPDVLLGGRKQGLWLKKDGVIADTEKGDPVPAEEDLYPPLTKDDLKGFDNYSLESMMDHVSFIKKRKKDIQGFGKIPTDKREPDFSCYNIIGPPESDKKFDIKSSDGLCLYSYSIKEGEIIPFHRRPDNQVLFNTSGDILLRFRDSDWMPVTLGPGDVYDPPKDAVFSIECIRGESYIYCIVNGENTDPPDFIS